MGDVELAPVQVRSDAHHVTRVELDDVAPFKLERLGRICVGVERKPTPGAVECQLLETLLGSKRLSAGEEEGGRGRKREEEGGGRRREEEGRGGRKVVGLSRVSHCLPKPCAP